MEWKRNKNAGQNIYRCMNKSLINENNMNHLLVKIPIKNDKKLEILDNKVASGRKWYIYPSFYIILFIFYKR